jgi:hypothetical protein
LRLLGGNFGTQQVRCDGHWRKVISGEVVTGKTNQLIPMAVGDVIMFAPPLPPLGMEGGKNFIECTNRLVLCDLMAHLCSSDVRQVQGVGGGMNDGGWHIPHHNRILGVKQDWLVKEHGTVLRSDFSYLGLFGDQ